MSMVKGFYHTGSSWYGKSVLSHNVFDDIMIGMYDDQGQGCEYEFVIEWEYIIKQPTPRLGVYGEAWKGLFNYHQDLLDFLSKQGNDLKPEELIRFLENVGYKNLTKYTQE